MGVRSSSSPPEVPSQWFPSLCTLGLGAVEHALSRKSGDHAPEPREPGQLVLSVPGSVKRSFNHREDALPLRQELLLWDPDAAPARQKRLDPARYALHFA